MDPLQDLLRSPTGRYLDAPYDIPELGIRAGDTLSYDPEDPDVIIQARVIPREFLEAALETRDREFRRKFAEAARHFRQREERPAGGAGKGQGPRLRLVR